MELKASKEREGFGKLRDEVRDEGCERSGMGVGWGKGGGHGCQSSLMSLAESILA